MFLISSSPNILFSSRASCCFPAPPSNMCKNFLPCVLACRNLFVYFQKEVFAKFRRQRDITLNLNWCPAVQSSNTLYGPLWTLALKFKALCGDRLIEKINRMRLHHLSLERPTVFHLRFCLANLNQLSSKPCKSRDQREKTLIHMVYVYCPLAVLVYKVTLLVWFHCRAFKY